MKQRAGDTYAAASWEEGQEGSDRLPSKRLKVIAPPEGSCAKQR